MFRARLVARLVMDVKVPSHKININRRGDGLLLSYGNAAQQAFLCKRAGTRRRASICVPPFEMCLTKEVVPLDTPLTKAPGPRVRPSYGSRKKSDTPLPMLRTRLAGLPRISKDPTTQPET